MDQAKCDALKDEMLAQPAPQSVTIQRFFDGNDDAASIGCNLLDDHPGMDTFRAVLIGLLNRQDVSAVYAIIAEVDPGEEYWPFTDTVLVVGSITPEALSAATESLHPDEAIPAGETGFPSSVIKAITQDQPAVALWWD